MRWSAMLALALAGCAHAGPQEASASQCGPVPLLEFDQQFAWPASLQEGGADRSRFRAHFATAYEQACDKKIIPATGMTDREGKSFDNITVINHLDANTLMIYRADAEFGGGMTMQDIFVTLEGTIHVPTVDDFLYEIECVMRPENTHAEELQGGCMYD